MAGSPPTNLASLLSRLYNLAADSGVDLAQIQRAMANVVVGQMLSSGVIKGGAAVKMRAGDQPTRFTTDLDALRPRHVSLDGFIDEFRDNLATGWCHFTGTLEELRPARPSNVPQLYVMQPFRIRLRYRGRHWLSVPFELNVDELDAAAHPEFHLARDLSHMFTTIGLDAPDAVRLLPVEHQIAQKLHACTDTSSGSQTNQRAHDLVDLQILVNISHIDWLGLRGICRRLFVFRQRHAWPPQVVAALDWLQLYEAAAGTLEVLPTVDQAVAWTNDLIRRIENTT